ncbi:MULTISPECIES: hypothetical protein [unclassified Microcoleus]|nr:MULTISPECIES: hypothetical protein [unclassified Microcoleus]
MGATADSRLSIAKCDRPKTITAFLQKTIALFGESDRLNVNY